MTMARTMSPAAKPWNAPMQRMRQDELGQKELGINPLDQAPVPPTMMPTNMSHLADADKSNVTSAEPKMMSK